jgi:Helix-turn-helix domain
VFPAIFSGRTDGLPTFMSISKMTDAWKVPCETHTQKLVLIALADNASDQGLCWPSLSTLARKCDLSRQGVIDQIEKLGGCGLVKTVKKDGLTNRYIVLPDQSTALTSSPKPLVNGVDYHQSTALTRPVNGVDRHLNRQEPSIEPSGCTRTPKAEKKTSEATPANLQMVKERAREIGLPLIEAEKFWNHFESNGWKVSGKTPMKNWHCALRNWQLQQKLFEPYLPNGHSRSEDLDSKTRRALRAEVEAIKLPKL